MAGNELNHLAIKLVSVIDKKLESFYRGVYKP